MRIFWTLARRELAAFFCSITGYVIIAAVTFLIGLSFVVLMTKSGQRSVHHAGDGNVFQQLLISGSLCILATPVITMRLFALEKASGTFETLMTTPVGDMQVVAAKFTTAVILYMVMWLPTLACLFIVRHFTNQASALDAGTIGRNVSGHFPERLPVSIHGLFCVVVDAQPDGGGDDQFVRRRVVLFITGFFSSSECPPSSNGSRKCCMCFNLFKQMDDFTRGVVDTRAVVFYVSLTFFFLFLTLRAVESRRWK